MDKETMTWFEAVGARLKVIEDKMGIVPPHGTIPVHNPTPPPAPTAKP